MNERATIPAGVIPLFGDGLSNAVTRLGTTGDKSQWATYFGTYFSQMEVDQAYRTSWFKKIVDIVPFDEVREWRTWSGADSDQTTAIDAEEKRLGVRQKIKLARTLARKDGGAAIVMGDGKDATKALDVTGAGGLKYIAVLNRFQIVPGDRQLDPSKEADGEAPFMEPKFYYLATGQDVGTQVHWTRVIRFIGEPNLQAGFYDGWGDSLWHMMNRSVTDADRVMLGIAALVEETKIDVVRLKNLANNLATDDSTNLLVKRWGSMMQLKSMMNALILDFDDEYTQKTQTFQGLGDITDRALMVMSGMADIPATRLLGRAPQGMNSTGESDMRNYYDRIRSGQQVDLQPLIKRLDDAIVVSAGVALDPAVMYEWTPLYQMSEKEASVLEKDLADAAVAYANAGLIPDAALTAIVRDGMIERGNWPGAQQAFDDAEAAGEVAGLTAAPTPAELAAEQAKIATAQFTAANPGGSPGALPGKRPAFGDSAPRSLYVRRQLLNANDVIAWAKSQGFMSTLEPADMHVTIVFSRDALDWMTVPNEWSFGKEDGSLTVPPGGARLVEMFGDACVLEFNSTELAWRHQAIKALGASSDFQNYQPHVTISYGGQPAGIGTFDDPVKPYTGKLVFGPEIFETVNPDWKAGIIEAGT